MFRQGVVQYQVAYSHGFFEQFTDICVLWNRNCPRAESADASFPKACSGTSFPRGAAYTFGSDYDKSTASSAVPIFRYFFRTSTAAAAAAATSHDWRQDTTKKTHGFHWTLLQFVF